MYRFFVLLIVCWVWSVETLHAQTDDSYMPYRNPRTAHLYQVDTIEVDGIVYERILDKKETDRITFVLWNIENCLGSQSYRLKDGSRPPKKDESYNHGKVDMAAMRRAIRSAFTAEENRILGEEKAKISMYLVFDVDTGAVLEVDFINRPTKMMLSLPLSRFATFEKNIKRWVTTHVTDPDTRQLQFVSTLIILKFPLEDY